MKVKFWFSDNANIHAGREEVLDTVKDMGLEEGEWEGYTDEEKYKFAEQHAWDNGLEIGYDEEI